MRSIPSADVKEAAAVLRRRVVWASNDAIEIIAEELERWRLIGAAEPLNTGKRVEVVG